MKVQRVTNNGALRWKTFFWENLSAALKANYVGIRHVGNGIWTVYYRGVYLGFFDEYKQRE